MILKNLFDLKHTLLNKLENHQINNTTEEKLRIEYQALLYHVLRYSKRLTSDNALHNYKEEEQDCINRLEIDLRSEIYCEKDMEMFHFLFELVSLQKGFYPAQPNTSYQLMADKMNGIVGDPATIDMLCNKSTLVDYLSNSSKDIDSLSDSEFEAAALSQVYKSKVRVVRFDLFLDHVLLMNVEIQD